MSTDPEDRLARSWDTNASAWIAAVREQLIPSRKQATDAAIVAAVLDQRPRRALDLGCGEGWLARALHEREIDVVGVDASEALIASAREQGGGEFKTCSYDQLVAEPERVGTDFDVVVSNFALLHEEITPILSAARSLLAPDGALILQTVHPWTSGGETYEDGWMEETFESVSDDFAEPMPWYFRTLASWTQVLSQSGCVVREVREPRAPGSSEPLSVLFVAVPRRAAGE